MDRKHLLRKLKESNAETDGVATAQKRQAALSVRKLNGQGRFVGREVMYYTWQSCYSSRQAGILDRRKSNPKPSMDASAKIAVRGVLSRGISPGVFSWAPKAQKQQHMRLRKKG